MGDVFPLIIGTTAQNNGQGNDKHPHPLAFLFKDAAVAVCDDCCSHQFHSLFWFIAMGQTDGEAIEMLFSKDFLCNPPT